MTSSVDLLLPGLFAGVEGATGLPRLPYLERLLARSERIALPVRGVWPTLTSLCGVGDAAELPRAPCCAVGEGMVVGDRYLLLASPVYMSVEQARVRLFPARQVGLEDDEADLLFAELEAHFYADGWHFRCTTPGHWYLQPPQPPRLRTTPLEEVGGRHIDPLLPSGPDAPRYHALMNEVQMLLHGSAVNRAREERGVPPINGVWLHGGGVASRLNDFPYVRVIADDPCVRGLGLLAAECSAEGGRPPVEVAISPGWPLDSHDGRVLLFDGALSEACGQAGNERYGDALERIDRDLLGPLSGALREGRIAQLDLHVGDGRCFRLSRAADRRFWRRPRPLSHYAATSLR